MLEAAANLFSAMIRLSTPITLAAIGAVICERAGIVNIAMEGIMLMGAFFAAMVAYYTGNPWVGLLAGALFGLIFAAIHAMATITLHLDHVVSGAVINIIAFGLTRYLMVQFFGHPGTSEPIPISLAAFRFRIPLLSNIPFFGDILFNQTPIVYLSFALVILLWAYMRYSKVGLHVRAAGEHPLALATIGISVIRVRYGAVLFSGLLCGIAGAFLSIENNTTFTEGMTSGRGFIALAANISGGWTVLGAFVGSLFFGLADALQIRFQTLDIHFIPQEVFVTLPYIAAIIAVAGLVRNSRAPKALGSDFMIEHKE